MSGAAAAGRTRRKFAELASQTRTELQATDPKSFFIGRASVVSIVLRKRWHGHSVTITSTEFPTGRAFAWKPALNRFDIVEDVFRAAFGDLVSRA